jgi:hypothetical protein
MTDIYTIAIATLVVIFVLAILILQFGFGEELKCLVFNDGKTAVINKNLVVSFTNGGHGYSDSHMCDGYQGTIAWFFQKGYKVTYWGENEVYMIR